MKLYWSTKHNFGDSLNPWLWEKLLPGAFDEDSSELLIGIGTILNHKIPAAGHKHVFGSGCGYGWPPNVHTSDWTVHCVRGPRTAAKLGISVDLAITDPAVLIRRFVPPSSAPANGIAFIPHFESLDVGEWEIVCRLANISFINPCDTIENVIDKIRGSKLVVAEAMHGAIVADALRVPWIPVKPLIKKNENKWFDWFESLGLVCQPQPLSPSSVEEALKVRYSRLREFAKEELFRRNLFDQFADKSPIHKPATSENDAAAATTETKITVGDRLRKLSDGVVPTLNRIIIPPVHDAISRALRNRAAETLTRIAATEPYLSSDQTIENLTQRLQGKLALLRRQIQNRSTTPQHLHVVGAAR
jgi:succinoglycan biosynthesis protein ExoV